MLINIKIGLINFTYLVGLIARRTEKYESFLIMLCHIRFTIFNDANNMIDNFCL